MTRPAFTRGPSPAGDGRALTGMVVLLGAGYALIGVFRHWRFESSAYDLGIFDQAVWHWSRFETPASTISGFANILGDHFYPILALFAPLYWFVPRAETLIVAQAALFALSMAPVFLFLRKRLPRGAAYALTAASGLFWGIQRAAAFDVHEMAFAPLAIATAILAMDERRWGLFWTAVAAIMLTKEDLIPLLAALGVYLVGTGERRQGLLLILSSAAAFLLIVTAVVPAFNASGAYGYISTYGDIIARPWELPARIVTPAIKIETLFYWLAPFLFLPLASRLVIALVPIALERFLSASPNHWGTSFHYSAPLAPVLAMSAGDGLARLARRFAPGREPGVAPRWVAVVSGVVLLLCSILPDHLPLWRLVDPKTYRMTASHQTGHEIVRTIPVAASVAAQAAIVPHLSERETIYMLDGREIDTDYIIAAADLSPWPNESFVQIEAMIERARQRGYVAIVEKNGWTVLKKNAAAKPAAP